jgi:hypothetical protein
MAALDAIESFQSHRIHFRPIIVLIRFHVHVFEPTRVHMHECPCTVSSMLFWCLSRGD